MPDIGTQLFLQFLFKEIDIMFVRLILESYLTATK